MSLTTHPESHGGSRRDGGVAHGEVLATNTTRTRRRTSCRPARAIRASVGVAGHEFAGANGGGSFAGDAPFERSEAVFGAFFVDQGEDFMFPLFGGDFNDGDSDRIVAATVVGAGSDGGGAGAGDDRVAASV